MNFRVTFLFFGILLGMLWLFGLILAVKKTRYEEDFVLPSLHGSPDVDIYAVKIERTKKGKRQSFTFTKSGGEWTMRKDKLTPVVRVMESKIRGIIGEIRNAQKNREADVYNDPAKFGLKNPQMSVRLNGRSAKKSDEHDEWVLYIGNESPKKEFVYVNTSDAPDQVFAVRKSTLSELFFDNAASLRPLQLLSVTEFQVSKISLKRTKLDKAGKSSSSNVVLKKMKDDKWEFVEPNLGAAEFEGGEPKIPTAKRPKTSNDNVRGLIAAINEISVAKTEDFVPITEVGLSAYRLDEGRELLRIQVETEVIGEKNKTSTVNHTLLIGNPVPKEDKSYARLAGDQGVVKIDKDALKLVEKVLSDPGVLRSRRLIFADKSGIDAVDINVGKTSVLLRKAKKDGWHVQFDGEFRPADKSVVETLLNILDDSQAILEFIDDGETETQLKAMGLKSPTTVVEIWKNGIAEETPVKNGKKKAKTKDAVKKTKEANRFKLDDDAKPIAKLSFGKTNDDTVYVKREIAGVEEPSYVKVDKTVLDDLAPKQGAIAFLRRTMNGLAKDQVTQIALNLEGKKFLLKRRRNDRRRWRMTEQKDFAGRDHVDAVQVTQILGLLEKLTAKKWMEQINAKTDLSKFGLKKPPLTVSLTIWNGKPRNVAALVGLSAVAGSPAVAVANTVALPDLNGGKNIVYKFGDEADDEDDIGGVYATSSQNSLLFLADPNVVSRLKDADPRDRSWLFALQAVIDASMIGMSMPPQAFNALLPVSPISTNEVHTFVPKDVERVTLKMRTQFLTFNMKLVRTKDGWKDESGLEGFKLDSKTVDEFVETIAELKPRRFVTLQGPLPSDFKLSDAEASLVVDIKLKNGPTVHFKIGSQLAGKGYLASTSQWKDAVFVVSDLDVLRYLRGVGVFSKEP